jgi:lysophospholipase L1-like esterase
MKKKVMRFPAAVRPAALLAAALLAGRTVPELHGQTPAAPQDTLPVYTTEQDHRNMMDQLGIGSLRPGPSGDESKPDHANYDTTLANPFPDWPGVLTLKNGKSVATPDAWWKRRRPEIVEDFEREVLGRVPEAVPPVTWTVVRTVESSVGPYPVIGRELVGRVDNSSCPGITVEIKLALVTPSDAEGPVPVMIMFGFGGIPLPKTPPAAGMPAPPAPPSGAQADPPARQQLIAGGWGYAVLQPGSVQADNGAGLTAGIIGLVNRGRFRKPDDWGALRAWAWGASRALDYLETDPAVDAGRVGIEGVSRYGKAALVTMAFDRRFAVVLVGSSGEGGAKPHRRNFGEAVENLTGSGEYHWMAGNFLKYGAAEASFGSRNAGDLPVDSHELIALCAPRPTFISYGVPEKGDAKWLDQQGSFMAAVAAGPAFRLLGAADLGVSDDYRKAKMPPVNRGLLDGRLAWRQHDGGHTDGPNWKFFIPWADRQLGHRPPAPAPWRPAERTDANSRAAHAQLVEKARKGGIDVYFEGDSITRRWGATDYPAYLENWKANFFGWNAADFGWGADSIENILWRLWNGELDGVNPKVIVLLAGTNNVGNLPPPEGDSTRAANMVRGIRAVLDVMREKAPDAVIVLTALFPRNDAVAVMPVINRVNAGLAGLADGRTIRFLDVNSVLADADGRLFPGMMNPDGLHPSLPGYQAWADGLKPLLAELLGPPAKEDHAPPPTGNPGL